MRLTELSPQFVCIDDGGVFRHVATAAEAHGIRFRCPNACGIDVFVCFEGRGVPPQYGAGLRWEATGDGYEDLTLRPSIHIVKPCGWHGYVTNGEVTTC
jgi:hypothetical protein